MEREKVLEIISTLEGRIEKLRGTNVEFLDVTFGNFNKDEDISESVTDDEVCSKFKSLVLEDLQKRVESYKKLLK